MVNGVASECQLLKSKREFAHHLLKLLWVVIATVITIGSLIPVDTLPETAVAISDKIQHAFAYFCLGIIGVLAWRSFKYRLLVVTISFLIGIGIEYVQPLTGRHFEYADMLANTSGLVTAIVLGSIWHYRKKTTNSIN